MLKVKIMKFSNLILLVGTIGISNAFDRNETLISTSSGIGKANGNETSVIDMLASLLVDSTNLCISTLTLSTCACEPKESESIIAPDESPKYEGDEWDKYAETSKVASTTLNPDYVLRTNFSTNRRSHYGSLDKKGRMRSVIITHSKLLENLKMTLSSPSEHVIQSLTFPSISISSTRGHYYNTLTSVHHNVSFNTGYHNSSISTGYNNVSSTIHNVSLSSYISTSEHTIIDETSTTSSEEIVTTVAETETPTSQTHKLHHITSTTHGLITNTAKSDHPTTDETKYADNEERTPSQTETEKLLVPSLIPHNIMNSTIVQRSNNTAVTTPPHEPKDHKTVLETSSESRESTITTSMQTKATTEPSMDLYYPSTTSQKTTTSQTSYIHKPTILPEDSWSDYWSEENWSEEWPSEFWSEVFKETSKPDNQAGWKTHSTVERHSISASIKTNTKTGKMSHSEHRSVSKLQGIVYSTHPSEGSFRILPTSHIPKQTNPSTENSSHEHQTEGHHTATSHIPKQPNLSTQNASHEHQTEGHYTATSHIPKQTNLSTENASHEHQTDEHQTEAHHTEEHHTEEHHTEEHQTKTHQAKTHQTKTHQTKTHQTKTHQTKTHQTKTHQTKTHHTKQTPSAESTFSPSEAYEHIYHTSEISVQTTIKSNVESHMSSTLNNNVKPTTVRSKSNAPKISHTEYSSYTTEEGPTSFSKVQPSISPSISPSLSTHSTGRYHGGSSYNAKTSYYSKRSRLSTTASLSSGHLLFQHYPQLIQENCLIRRYLP